MWPQIGSIPTYSILYIIGILSHYLISCLLARRLGLRHWRRAIGETLR